MVRALTIACLALAVLGGSARRAAAKPAVAILGVEVSDPNNQGIDQASTEAAKGLTDGLRLRAKAGTGPLVLAPGSDKELIDEKMLNSCDNEQNACMAKIGADLNAEQLMFGNIQKKSTGYLVSMKLLSVPGRNIIRSVNETIPYGDSQGAPLQSWAKKIYGKLTGDISGGILAIKANVERGTVLIEGEPKGNLVGYRATVSGLSEGRYKLSIDAEGYKRYETSVTINAGETTNAEAKLDPAPRTVVVTTPTPPGPFTPPPPTPATHHDTNIWAPIAIASAVVAAGGATFWIVSDVQEQNAASLAPKGEGPSDCGVGDFEANSAAFHRACQRRSWTFIGGGITIGAGVIAGVSTILALRHHSTESPVRTSGRKHHDAFAVTPVLLPNGGGASFALEW